MEGTVLRRKKKNKLQMAEWQPIPYSLAWLLGEGHYQSCPCPYVQRSWRWKLCFECMGWHLPNKPKPPLSSVLSSELSSSTARFCDQHRAVYGL